MQIQIALLCASLFYINISIASTSPPTKDSLKIGIPLEKVVQLGVSFHHAVRKELKVPTVEGLIQPIPFLSFGYRVGRISTSKRPDLFAGTSGWMRGYVGRIDIPIDTEVDLYFEYSKTDGSLPFSAIVFGVSESDIDPRFEPATHLAGSVDVRQNNLLIGIRYFFGKFLFIDASLGFTEEKYILIADGLKNGPSTKLFRNNLDPNIWHERLGPKVGFTLGVRL